MRVSRYLLITLIAAFALALVGCSSASSSTSGDSAHSKEVSANQYGDAWPLTVDSGTLACDGGAVTFTTTDGTVYPVNGTAMDQMQDGPDLHDIWANDPEVKGEKKYMVLIDDGLKLCD